MKKKTTVLESLKAWQYGAIIGFIFPIILLIWREMSLYIRYGVVYPILVDAIPYIMGFLTVLFVILGALVAHIANIINQREYSEKFNQLIIASVIVCILLYVFIWFYTNT